MRKWSITNFIVKQNNEGRFSCSCSSYKYRKFCNHIEIVRHRLTREYLKRQNIIEETTNTNEFLIEVRYWWVLDKDVELGYVKVQLIRGGGFFCHECGRDCPHISHVKRSVKFKPSRLFKKRRIRLPL